jgi:predicted DNA-binding transcriptional regulator AlpA
LIQLQPSETSCSAFAPFLTDKELANILIVAVPWIRGHAHEIPGFERLGSYYRFRRSDLDQWLGSLDRLFECRQVAAILNVPPSWVYANADSIPGVLRLGRYVRFRPAELNRFLAASSVAQ